MDKFLANFSKNTLAFVAIVGGILFIVLSQPPVSICDTQIDVIKNTQRLMLFPDPKSKMVKTTKFQTLLERCRRTNDPGGCYEMFQATRILLQDLSTLPRECGATAGSVKEIKEALWETTNIIVRVGWGEKPPSTYHAKFGWLDSSDVSLFCQLKGRLQNTYGEAAWNKYRKETLEKLPGANELPGTQVWELSLFSENCSRYP